jgi:hypothetical protein
MWLKMEVRKLRKAGTQIAEADEEIQAASEYALTAEVQTWKSTVVRYQNEVRRTRNEPPQLSLNMWSA